MNVPGSAEAPILSLNDHPARVGAALPRADAGAHDDAIGSLVEVCVLEDESPGMPGGEGADHPARGLLDQRLERARVRRGAGEEHSVSGLARGERGADRGVSLHEVEDTPWQIDLVQDLRVDLASGRCVLGGLADDGAAREECRRRVGVHQERRLRIGREDDDHPERLELGAGRARLAKRQLRQAMLEYAVELFHHRLDLAPRLPERAPGLGREDLRQVVAPVAELGAELP
jgi:hypothetical protein